jgi:hypothetical protein
MLVARIVKGRLVRMVEERSGKRLVDLIAHHRYCFVGNDYKMLVAVNALLEDESVPYGFRVLLYRVATRFLQELRGKRHLWNKWSKARKELERLRSKPDAGSSQGAI